MPRAGFHLTVFALLLISASARADEAFLKSEFIFQPEHWHAHASCVVEAPDGALLACWFQGSGERKADDVKIEGGWLAKGATNWSPRLVMTDTPGYPDGNPAMFVDPQGRLWLLSTTIVAHTWESALLKVRIARDWGAKMPRWEKEDVIHVTPNEKFLPAVNAWLDGLEKNPIVNSVD